MITLESDDDGVDNECISTDSVPLSQLQSSSTVRPFKLKRSWVTVPAEPGQSLSVSININLPGPSHSRAGPSRRLNSRLFRPVSNSDTSSDSDVSPDWTSDRQRSRKKTPIKKPKCYIKVENKRPKVVSTRSSHRETPVANKKTKSSKVLVLPLKKRRLVLNLSSDDEHSVSQVDAESELISLVEPEVREDKLLSKTVVVKHNIKEKTLHFSDPDLSEIKTETILNKADTKDSSGHDMSQVISETLLIKSETQDSADHTLPEVIIDTFLIKAETQDSSNHALPEVITDSKFNKADTQHFSDHDGSEVITETILNKAETRDSSGHDMPEVIRETLLIKAETQDSSGHAMPEIVETILKKAETQESSDHDVLETMLNKAETQYSSGHAMPEVVETLHNKAGTQGLSVQDVPEIIKETSLTCESPAILANTSNSTKTKKPKKKRLMKLLTK